MQDVFDVVKMIVLNVMKQTILILLQPMEDVFAKMSMTGSMVSAYIVNQVDVSYAVMPKHVRNVIHQRISIQLLY